MLFNSFINPFQNPADVPGKYRKHAALQKLFKARGAYVRPAEDPVTIWAIDILHAETVVAEAKARVERMILGEENAA